MSDAEIDLGFTEDREAAWLTNRYFPSKLGGQPAWLNLELLPSKEQMLCNSCKNPRSFLCQIYAPFEDKFNFHRSLFVFICRAPGCQVANKADNLLVLRSQLGRRNAFFSDEPPLEEGEPLPAVPCKQKLCWACGCVGPLSCGRCKQASYCSAAHQRAHWPQHKKSCSTEATIAVAPSHNTHEYLPGIVFPEMEIVIEPYKSSADKAVSTKDEATCLNEFKQLQMEGKTGTLSELPAEELDKYMHNTDASEDKQFRKFKKEIAKDCEQILRYKRSGEPLWITDAASTGMDKLQIPNCEYCASPRQFEFQIMPQMLCQLGDEHLDWGVLAIYTCPNSCQLPSELGYAKEFIVKQDIVANNK